MTLRHLVEAYQLCRGTYSLQHATSEAHPQFCLLLADCSLIFIFDLKDDCKTFKVDYILLKMDISHLKLQTKQSYAVLRSAQRLCSLIWLWKCEKKPWSFHGGNMFIKHMSTWLLHEIYIHLPVLAIDNMKIYDYGYRPKAFLNMSVLKIYIW